MRTIIYGQALSKRLSQLLRNFEDKDRYCEIIDKFRKKRGKVFHNAIVETMPDDVLPDIDPDLGIGRRETTLAETISKFGEEGLATKNAKILLHEVVYAILLNELMPDLDFWPKLEMLKIFRLGPVASGIIKG